MNYANTYTVDIDYDGMIDGPLDYSHGFLNPLDENSLNEAAGVAFYASTEGMGWEEMVRTWRPGILTTTASRISSSSLMMRRVVPTICGIRWGTT